MGVDPSGRLMFCHGSDNAVELFSVCGAEEVKRRCQKRARKERRKVRAANSNEEAAAEDVTVPEPTIQVGDQGVTYTSACTYRVAHLVADLGWVNLNFDYSTVCLILPGLVGVWEKRLGSWARWGNSQIQVNRTQVGDQMGL